MFQSDNSELSPQTISHSFTKKDKPAQLSGSCRSVDSNCLPWISPRLCPLCSSFLCNAKELIKIPTCLRNCGSYIWQMFVSSLNPQVGWDYCYSRKARSKGGSFTFCLESNEICGHSHPFWEQNGSVPFQCVKEFCKEESNMFRWIRSITRRKQKKKEYPFFICSDTGFFSYRLDIIQSLALPWHCFGANLLVIFRPIKHHTAKSLTALPAQNETSESNCTHLPKASCRSCLWVVALEWWSMWGSTLISSRHGLVCFSLGSQQHCRPDLGSRVHSDNEIK